MDLWIGIEQEGKHKGLKTLFIGSPKIQFKEISDLIEKHKVEQIYFGAGCCTEISQDVVFRCLNEYKLTKLIITMEILSSKIYLFDKDLLKKTSVIITYNNEDFNYLKKLNIDLAQIKLQTITSKNIKDNILVTMKLNDLEYTNLNDLEGKKYKGDIIIK